MSGHNKWSQIKEKKGAVDAKRGKLFTKLVKLIKTEARITKGDLNAPTLRAAIEKARAANMPKDNIDRAVQSAQGTSADEKVLYEAFGPGGCAIIIEGLTDSKNRTSQEMKHLLSENGLTLAAPGSASWAFTKEAGGWMPTTTVPLSEEDGAKLSALIEELEDNDDVQEVYTNAE